MPRTETPVCADCDGFFCLDNFQRMQTTCMQCGRICLVLPDLLRVDGAKAQHVTFLLNPSEGFSKRRGPKDIPIYYGHYSRDSENGARNFGNCQIQKTTLHAQTPQTCNPNDLNLFHLGLRGIPLISQLSS